MLFKVFLVASLLSMVLGEIQITSPMNSIFRAGSDAHIEWISSGDSDSLGTIDIVLMTGSATRLALIGTIANDVPVQDGQYLWKVPEELPPAKDYVLRLGAKQQFFYSTNFEVSDKSGPAYPDVLNAGDTRPKKSTTVSSTTSSDKTSDSASSKKVDSSKPATLSDSAERPAKAKSSAKRVSPMGFALAAGVTGFFLLFI
ncbi:hypothetical protein K493DRAFT_302102 [Basidiobolus meristosporus CBS 931.73]|uniref:Yeast cell wall synthesis Kre9/Knh1-like N-terminal domain-containing protein n=1 Tax=Basidiobolus meristosporus CBS 931.73 TaxID=1314790 RepID=A0A1Y1Y8N9_9FUNG|nr:hypothetical protein K493DRAFT_302102 [Basidiobolus meristosporus CBS 931.73]|eukprot:ORX94390.1 hypothetical protein K493DRAFT_302102 [Basidiobolus meristosporus CBS 931.73]